MQGDYGAVANDIKSSFEGESGDWIGRFGACGSHLLWQLLIISVQRTGHTDDAERLGRAYIAGLECRDSSSRDAALMGLALMQLWR